MSRPSRVEIVGALQRITLRGDIRDDIYLSDDYHATTLRAKRINGIRCEHERLITMA